MKKLILIIGPNGVGKTTTAKILLQKLSKCAYVDADWCRAINPFPFMYLKIFIHYSKIIFCVRI